MFPELIKIGSISIKSYGFFVAVGFLLALNYARNRAGRVQIPGEFMMNLGLYVVISGIIGARIVYVLLNWNYYRGNFLEVFQVWSGGLVLYGGFLTGFTAGLIYTLKKKVEVWKLADITATSFFLGLAFGRIGCFLAGCCYGKPTSLFCGVTFNNILSLAPQGVKLHPAQLYESVFCMILFLAMHFYSRVKKFKGQVFFLSTGLYGIWRFFIEFLRGDDRGSLVFDILYPSQFISVLVLIICIVMYVYLSRKSKSL